MSISFNLIDEKWIPVVTLDLKLEKVSLKELLTSASSFKEISAATPIETISLYRLCLAMLHAIYEIDEDSWQEMWVAKSFDNQKILAYCQKWRHRFDLFDSHRPFFQDATLTVEEEPASSLLGHIAAGNDSTLFSHNLSTQTQIFSIPDVASALIAFQSFGVGGTKRPGNPLTDGYSARGINFLLNGDNLFETLLLNSFNINDKDEDIIKSAHLVRRQVDMDKPAWEMENPFDLNPNRPYGFLDFLTWQNRKILLIPLSDGQRVSHMRYDAGLRTSNTKGEAKKVRDVFNPLYYWYSNTKQGKADNKEDKRSHSPISFSPDKSLWRNSATFLQMVDKSQSEEARNIPIAAVRWLSLICESGLLSRTQRYLLSGLGMATKSGQDKTFFYRAEHFPLPIQVISNPDAISQISDAITAAESIKQVLINAVNKLARWIYAPQKEDEDVAKDKDLKQRINNLAQSWNAEERYWGGLEAHFHRFISDLPNDAERASDVWQGELKKAVQQAFNYVANSVAGDPRAHRAIAVASSQFEAGMKRIFLRSTDKTNKPEEVNHG